MSATVPFTIKLPVALKRELKRTARLRGQKPSATARAFLEEGRARHKPGGMLGAGKNLLLAERLDPSLPVYSPREWATL